MDFKQVLVDLGLKDKEPDVYMTILKIPGAQPASMIAGRCNLNRTTVYKTLVQLAKKGLVTKTLRHGVTCFFAEDPEGRLNKLIEKKREGLSEMNHVVTEALPLLTLAGGAHETTPRIRYYEGVEGLRQVYDEILEYTEIFAYVCMEEVVKLFPENPDKFREAIKSRQIKLREILEDSEVARAYAKHINNKLHEVKFVPQALGISVDYLICGDRVYIMNFGEQPMSIVIHGKEIYETSKAIFQLAWGSSTKA